MSEDANRRLEAFRRLLAMGSGGGQAKIDAIVALAQRTVFVPTWTPDGSAFRTLVNSVGVTALPIFTDEEQLKAASFRFGWGGTDGRTPAVEVGAREALRFAVANDLKFVVVDIAASYSLQLERPEFEPLLAAKLGTDTGGPFAGVGISSSIMQSVKGASATTGKLVGPLSPPADDAFLSRIVAVLRSYMEVEWAAVCCVDHGSGAVATAALRVNGAFRTRMPEITAAVKAATREGGRELDVVLLDDPEFVRGVRAHGTAFYPWRKK